ncbi:hypothetical protein CDG60_01630 [Acinetobacter chinensis]|uniref:Lipoprotein n=1 Tax=Acinetobacter chinensis TaxID=2004650 RepID=A0A3B7LSN6_9GAMM|nr:hypothetical protein [Acinetobacter chinensis]AXY55421.1 hypothetical protein CDG60_01630 [Acinetobacter chinensis]
MKKLIQGALLPFAIFTAGVLLIGCEQAREAPVQENTTAEQSVSEQTMETQKQLPSGNMLYMIRDTADLQMKAGQYMQQLQQTQSDLQTAVQNKDQQLLSTSASELKQQLTGFNTALESLNLKSQEVESIRQQMLHASQQLLSSSFLNGDLDFSKINFAQIQQQIGSVQSEMLKLATMLLPQEKNTEQENTASAEQ